MLNFLTKRLDLVVYDTFMLAEILTFGEDKMLESLSRQPPDYFIINHRQKLVAGTS